MSMVLQSDPVEEMLVKAVDVKPAKKPRDETVRAQARTPDEIYESQKNRKQATKRAKKAERKLEAEKNRIQEQDEQFTEQVVRDVMQGKQNFLKQQFVSKLTEDANESMKTQDVSVSHETVTAFEELIKNVTREHPEDIIKVTQNEVPVSATAPTCSLEAAMVDPVLHPYPEKWGPGPFDLESTPQEQIDAERMVQVLCQQDRITKLLQFVVAYLFACRQH